MDKREGNIDQQSVSKAVAHHVEAAEVTYASAYQEPPPLFSTAAPEHVKKELESDLETEEKASSPELSAELSDVESTDPVGLNDNADASMIKGAVAPAKEDPEEEILESPDAELVFAEAPSDDGEGNGDDKGEGSGDSGGADPGDDQPIQNKEKEEEEEALQLKVGEEEESVQMKSVEEEEMLQLIPEEEEEESLQLKTEEEEDALQMKNEEEEEEAVQLKVEEEESVQMKSVEEETLQLKPEEEEEESLQLKTEEEEDALQLKTEEVVQRDSNLDLLEAGGHPRRNQHNEFPVGSLVPADGSSNPNFEYREGNNVFIDEAGRYWTMLSDEQNVYHQPPEVVDGFFDNQWQKLSHWWNDTERAPFPNKKFISDDGDTGGSFEAILQPNEDGTYSDNWLNSGSKQGTYNFYSPEGIGGNVGHFFFDILPHFANDDYDETPVQQKPIGTPNPDHQLSEKASSITPPADVMKKMEASFGTSFSNLKIHENSSKATENGALAYAQGNDIFFAPGKFQPETKKGQELLGHELAHIVQQRQGRVKPTTHLNNGTAVNDDPALEQEADELGAKAASFSLSTINKVGKQALPGQFSNVVQRQVAEEPISPEPPEPGLEGFSAEEIAAAESELNEPPGPPAPFKKVVEEPLPVKNVKKPAPEIKLPPKEDPKPTAKKSGAQAPFSPPSSNVSPGGKSIREYLNAASQPAIDEGKKKARELETNERRNEGAMVKTANAKKAVTAPPGEDQSRKDGDRTRETDAKDAPEVRKDKAKSEFEKSLDDSLPKKIKEVEKFKGSSKARQITDKAKKVIAEDKDLTTETYNSITRTEFSLTNPNDNPIPLGPIEEAEITAPFNIADKVVPDLQPLKSKFEGSTTEIEAQMAEQGVTAENLAAAKTSKLDQFKTDKTEFTTLETNLDSTLDGIYQEGASMTSAKFEEAEETSRKNMREERENKLNEAKDDQKTTTSDLEKKRKEVVDNIEAIYKPVEQKVNERLAKLDETTRIEFENGMNDATKEFEDNVNTRFKAFKKKRYKGFWGPAKWLKDKILGVNKLQEVKDILSEEKENYENNIDELIEDITARNSQVIELCKREINEAKIKIDDYIDSLPDALKDIARDAAKVIKDKLIELEDAVKEKEKELENLLGDLRQEAMDWVEDKIEEYNKKWGGVLSKILNFLADIALEILRGLMNAAGVDGDMIIDVVKDTVSAIIAIIKDPVGFLRNMIAIIKGGFVQFFSGGLRNLLDAFISWLTGSDGTIVFPTEWTLKNILMMLLDFFGLGWESIKGYFAEELGPQVVGIAENVVELITLIAQKGADGILEWIENKVGRIVEGGWSTFTDKYGKKLGLANIDIMEMFTELLQRIKSDGLAGVWDFIKEYGATLMQVLKDAVIDAVIDFAKNMVITAGINFLLTMATGIIGAIVKVVQIVIAFFENMGTIGKLVMAILKSVIHAAFNAIDAGISLIMDAIKVLIHMILNFLCRILGLGNIPKKVQDAIGTVVDGAQEFVRGVVKWISDKLKDLWQKLKDFFTNLFGGGEDEENGEGSEEEGQEGDYPTDFSHGVVPLNGQGMDSKGGGFAFPWGGSSGDYDFGGSPYGGGENARQVDLTKPELAGLEDDAEFHAEMDKLTDKAEEQKEHETTDQKVQETVDAAESPGNEVDSKAKSKQVDKMGEEDAGEFNSDDFKRKLLDKVDAIAPANLDETEKFRASGKAAQLKATIASDVSEEGKETKKDIEERAKESPDTSGFEPRDSEPLPPLPEMPDQGDIAEDKAAVKSQPDEIIETPIDEENAALDAQYDEAEITDEQLTAANEPTFTAALDAKTAAKQNMETTKVDFRTQEEEVIAKSQGEAETEGNEKLAAFLNTRNTELTNVEGAQKTAKSKDEQERKKVADQLEAIYGRTKSAVEAKLAGIDGQVNSMFDAAAETAKANFESYVDSAIQAYKAERYAGVSGAAQWVIDLFKGLPAEVNQFYTQARDLYVAEMDRAVAGIADFVTEELNAAKRLITQGKDEIERYVSQLDPNLQKYANEAASNITAKFEALDQTISDKQTELIDNLAAKYTENLGEIDTRVEELMASNQGLIQKAVDSVTSVIETINNMRNMLTSVINDGLAVVNEILKHPIQFLSNLIQGVSAGFNKFASNIGSHLQNGLSGWLFGTLGEAGIEIPSSFNLTGILSIITQVVGLTWNYIRARIVKFIGEENMARLETTVEMFQAFRRDGVEGFKEAAAEEGAEMKETVIGEIKQFVIEEVVKKGIVWILSLFNPASAFVKACMAIYDIVMFFVNRGAQIAELLQSVMGAIKAVVAGNVSAMATAIEGSLSRALPLAIGFIANLLGLGGLAAKVKAIIKKAQAPVNKVVDKVVGRAKNLAGRFGDKDDKDGEGNEEGEKDEAWDKAVDSLNRMQTQAANKGKTEKQMDQALPGIKSTHKLDRLTKSVDGEFWEVTAKKGDKRKVIDIKADFEGKDPQETSNDPEIEAKAQEGFADLRAKAAKFEGEGATKEEADKVVADVKRKHEVFEVLQVVGTNSADGWDVKFKYNPEDILNNVFDKEEDVIGQTPKIGLYKDFKGGKFKDEDSGREIQLIGHHVAEYKLAEILRSFYSNVSQKVDGIQGLEQFKDQARSRAELIQNNYIPGHGSNLSVILLSEEAHKGDVHGASQAESHLKQIENDLPEEEVRVVLVKKSDQKKVVSIRKGNWEAFLAAFIIIESDLEKEAGADFIKMEQSEGSQIIKVSNLQNGADSKLMDKAIDLYSDLMFKNEGEEINVGKIASTVNNATSSGVNAAIENGVSTISSALSNSRTDGENPTQIVGRLRSVAKTTWRPLHKNI